MAVILVVEDDVTFSRLVESFLQRHGYDVHIAASMKQAHVQLQQSQYDFVLLDYRLPDGLGIDLLHFMRDNGIPTPVVVMTSFNDIRTAVRTVRSGALDYITKPVNPDELLQVIKEGLSKKSESTSTETLPAFIKGNDPTSAQLYAHIELVAPTDFSVIIQGESGTGKEVAARTIHALSKRKTAPFIALDCGALSHDLAGSELFGHVKGAFTGALQNKRGLFEEANGGTLFLDEVGNLSYDVQVKLLRAIQEREIQPLGANRLVKVDVRIICATNENLTEAVRQGKFREDLYHRLNEFKIHVPSLSERKADMPEFINFFIAQANAELGKQVRGLSREVEDLFRDYDWPGNLRELRNILKRGVLLATTTEIRTTDLPQDMLQALRRHPASIGLREQQDAAERDLILTTLKKVNYNKSKAARLLNIDRTTLYYKIAKYNIE
jgi:two-component system response regulator HydG